MLFRRAPVRNAIRALLERVMPGIVKSADQQECYSQEGEDLIVVRLFEGKTDGFYVDIGAHHPIRHSNTHLLYRRGWRGINIDATPGSMAEFRRLRPRDINIECLVASDPSPRRFHVFNEPALNTASRMLASERPSENAEYQITGEVELRPRPLVSLLHEFLPKGTVIDLMSVDVEGLDLDVLRSNDWTRYRPKLLLVEVLHIELADLDRHEIVQFLRERNYRSIAKLYNTVVFSAR